MPPNINMRNLMRVLRRDRLWHRTGLEALLGIIKIGAIRPNDGSFPSTYPQSLNSYGRDIKAVSLFDFASASVTQIKDQEDKWRQFLSDQGLITIIIGINRSTIAGRLVPNGDAWMTLGTRNWIPHVEAWCRDEIPTTAFERYVVVSRGLPNGYKVLRGQEALDGVLDLCLDLYRAENDRLSNMAEDH